VAISKLWIYSSNIVTLLHFYEIVDCTSKFVFNFDSEWENVNELFIKSLAKIPQRNINHYIILN